MTRDNVIALVLARLRRPNDTLLAASIVTEMNLFQQMAAEKGDLGQLWFLLKYSELTLSSDRRQAALPAGFLSFPQEDGCLFLPAAIDADPTAMVAATRFQPAATFTGQFDTSSGAGWSFQGSTINFASQLNVGDTPVIIYYGKEALNESAYLSGGQPAANQWMTEAPDWFIAEMCHLFALDYLKYSDADARFGARKLEAKARLITQNTIQEEGARTRLMNDYYTRTRSSRGGFTAT